MFHSLPFHSRRHFLVSAAAFVGASLGGCSNSPVSRTIAAFWDQRTSKEQFTREQIQKLPYATLGVAIGNSPQAMLVLGRVEGDDLHWISADKGVLVTRHGRLVKTVGLADGDLGNTVMLDTDPLSRKSLQDIPLQWRRTIDLLPSRQFGMAVVADWIPEEVEAIQTIYGVRQARRIRERCHIPATGWRMENIFWVDSETGQAISSVQQFSPTQPTIRLDVLKPY